MKRLLYFVREQSAELCDLSVRKKWSMKLSCCCMNKNTPCLFFHSSSPISMSEILLKPKNYLELCIYQSLSESMAQLQSVPGHGGFKETKMFLPHPRVKVSIVGSLRDREVACSASDRQGANFEFCVWRTVSSQSSHNPQEVLLAQFSLYVHKGGLKPDSFHLYTNHYRNRWLSYMAFERVVELSHLAKNSMSTILPWQDDHG